MASLPASAPRVPGRVTTGARAARPTAAPATGPDLRCWAKFVRGVPYAGEYGFDWMDWTRDPSPQNTNDWIAEAMGVPIASFEYCYDERKQEYVEVATDPYLKRRLQEQYPKRVVYDEDYYIAWLSLRPGQEAKLRLQIEALNADPAAADFLTFGAHASYQVTVNGQVNEAIRLAPTATPAPAGAPPGTGAQFVDITVRCLRPCPATALYVLDENGAIAGQLNVVDNTKTYHLPVRVIYLVKQGAASSTDLANLKSGFAALNLKKYLNENSLNQAQIQADFENTNQHFELTFDEDAWAKEGFFDKANNWFTDRVYTTKDKQVKTEYILQRFLAVYLERYEKKENAPFRGVLLFMTSLPKNKADNEGGVAFTFPEPSRQCIIFQPNLGNIGTYAHEIAHVLGLEHSFWEKKEQEAFLETKNNINIRKIIIEKNRAITQSNRNAIKHNTDLSIKPKEIEIKKYEELIKSSTYPYKKEAMEFIAKRRSEIDKTKSVNIKIQKTIDEAAAVEVEFKDIITSTLRIFHNNPYKWHQNKTNCIMDYTSNRNSFYRFQWAVMQNDVIKFYGESE